MSSHPLDRSFRAKLGNGSASVPEGMWDAIETQLDGPSPASRGRAVYWVIPLLFVVTAFAFFGLKGALSSDEASTLSTPESALVNNSTNQGNNPVPAVTEAINDKDEGGLEESEKTKNMATSEGVAAIVPMYEQVASDGLTTEEANSEVKLNNVGKLVDQGQDLQGIADDDRLVNNAIGNQPRMELTDKIAEKAIPVRSLMSVDQINGTDAGVQSDFDLSGAVTDCYAFGKVSRGSWLAEVYTGPTYSIRSLDSKDEDVSGYIRGRDSTESSQISWHAGVRIGYEHSSGITGRVGFQYTLVNELFQQVSRTSGVLIDTTFDNMGNVIRIDTTIVDGERTTQVQNRYHSFDIPLLLGYRIDNGNWDFGIQVGPVFNVSHRATGVMQAADGVPFAFDEDSASEFDMAYSPVYNTSLGIGLYAGIYASMRVGESIWVFAEPNLHHRFGSITRDDFPIDQRQTNISLSLGVRYKF